MCAIKVTLNCTSLFNSLCTIALTSASDRGWSAGVASLAPKLWLKASLVFGLVVGLMNRVPQK